MMLGKDEKLDFTVADPPLFEECEIAFDVFCQAINALKSRLAGKSKHMQAATLASQYAIASAILETLPTEFDNPDVRRIFLDVRAAYRKKIFGDFGDGDFGDDGNDHNHNRNDNDRALVKR